MFKVTLHELRDKAMQSTENVCFTVHVFLSYYKLFSFGQDVHGDTERLSSFQTIFEVSVVHDVMQVNKKFFDYANVSHCHSLNICKSYL